MILLYDLIQPQQCFSDNVHNAIPLNVQLKIRLRQFQVLPEYIRHIEVEMLSGMADERIEFIHRMQPVVQRGQLDKIGSRAGDKQYIFLHCFFRI
jgi:hypothetical protein